MSSSPVLKTALLRLGGLLGQHAVRTGVGVGASAPSAFAAPLFCLDQRRWMAVPKRKVREGMGVCLSQRDWLEFG